MNKKLNASETTSVEGKHVKPVTNADKIWNDIKDEPLEMFALPKQIVHMYCEPIAIEPTKLYLKFTVATVLPALEVALKGLYNVKMIDKYICVSNVDKNN